jgi:dephospho-CoA kinase
MNNILLLKKYCIAITGGIASGKSSLANILKDLGYIVFDADSFTKQIFIQEKELIAKIVAEFGALVLDKDNKIDSKVLGGIVFKSNSKRKTLEKIMHPEINKYLNKAINSSRLSEDGYIFFYEASLIYETSSENKFREVWVTYCSRQSQIDRLIKRNKCDRSHAELIINSQLRSDVKKDKADFAIYTEQDFNSIKAQVVAYIENMHLA